MPVNPLGQQLRANRDNVWKAAQTLVDEGKQPSVNNVRQWLGGGSNSSISRYLQEWHASSQEERSVRLATPLHLQQSLDALFQQMEKDKDAAISSAEAAVNARIAALEQEKSDALAAHATAREEQARQQQALQAGAEREAALGEELAQQQKLLTESQRQLALVRQQAGQWQREAEDNRAQVNHLFHQQQHFQERWQAEASKRQEAFEESRWQWQNAQKKLEDALRDSQEDNRNLSGMVQALQQQASALPALKAEADDKAQALEQALAEVAALNSELARTSVAPELTEALGQQQQQLDTLLGEVAFLTEQVRKRQQLKSELEALKTSLGGA